MKWNRRNKVWHRWFAWHPIRTEREWVWLEVVSRRWSETFCGDGYEYRLMTADSAATAEQAKERTP
jgi:hypothetical protein